MTTARVRLTAGRIAAFTCPADKSQAFLWDDDVRTLAVRATPTGRKTYVMQSLLAGKSIRLTVGSLDSWTLAGARDEARRLQRLIDAGTDPREEKRQRIAEAEAARREDEAQSLTVGELWPRYMVEGRPKRRDDWKPRYIADIEKMVAPPRPRLRGKGMTLPGHLRPLMAMPLAQITPDALTAWHSKEAKRSKVQAERAYMVFRAFLRWAKVQPDLRDLVNDDASAPPALLDSLPAKKRRTDALETAQVAGWWAGVEQLPNRTASAYLRALLLTGARREELAGLRWEDVDFRWRKLTIADKVADTRTIPLTPYLADMLAALPRRNEFVFASTGKAGRITDARKSHERALQHAGIEHVTFHGLRRSFSLLGEASGCPAGALAQLMGHAPSALAESYRPRSIDALRPFAEQVERFILNLAGVAFEPRSEATPALRLVG